MPNVYIDVVSRRVTREAFPHTSALAFELELPCGDDVPPVGAQWNGEVFAPEPVQPTPVQPTPVQPTPSRKLTKLEYMNRFTDAELAVIYAAAKTVVQVEIWLEKFRLATDVDLEDPRTVAGVEAMEGAGLLAEGRAAEILA